MKRCMFPFVSSSSLWFFFIGYNRKKKKRSEVSLPASFALLGPGPGAGQLYHLEMPPPSGGDLFPPAVGFFAVSGIGSCREDHHNTIQLRISANSGFL